MNLNLINILKIMINAKDNKKIIQYNTYLQETISALIGPLAPMIIRTQQNYFKTGELPSKTVPKASVKLIGNAIILNSVGEWIDKDIKTKNPDLQQNLKLMLKLVKKVKEHKSLKILDLRNDN